MKKEHTPLPPIKVGTGSYLVYCNACLRLLYNSKKGEAKNFFGSCVPIKLVFK